MKPVEEILIVATINIDLGALNRTVTSLSSVNERIN
jgi:hypothetical protein